MSVEYDKEILQLRKERLEMKAFRKERAKELGKARIFRKFKRRRVNMPMDI